MRFEKESIWTFDAKGDLDAVTGIVLRVGARYTMKRETWNFYGGLAYEHELDGKATGKADGLCSSQQKVDTKNDNTQNVLSGYFH